MQHGIDHIYLNPNSMLYTGNSPCKFQLNRGHSYPGLLVGPIQMLHTALKVIAVQLVLLHCLWSPLCYWYMHQVLWLSNSKLNNNYSKTNSACKKMATLNFIKHSKSQSDRTLLQCASEFGHLSMVKHLTDEQGYNLDHDHLHFIGIVKLLSTWHDITKQCPRSKWLGDW